MQIATDPCGTPKYLVDDAEAALLLQHHTLMSTTKKMIKEQGPNKLIESGEIFLASTTGPLVVLFALPRELVSAKPCSPARTM